MRVRLIVVLPYPNPHFLGLIDALLSDARFETSIVYFASQERFRKNFKLGGFDGMKMVRIFSLTGITELLKAEVAMVHGLFYWHSVFVSLILFGKRVFFTSEPFNLATKPRVGPFIKRFLLSVYKVVFKEVVILSCGGEILKTQLTKLGLRCRYYRFGLFPRVEVNRTVLSVGPQSRVHFAFVGQFIPRKNLRLLFDAITKINGSEEYLKRYQFFFIGDGSERSEVLRLSQLYRNVRYLGVKSADEIREFFHTNHVLILPSFFDGWGAVVNEAVFSGNAILVTPSVYSSTMYLQESINGFYIEEGDSADLVERMKAYIDNHSFLHAHRCASIAIAESNIPSAFLDDLYRLFCGESNTSTLQPI